MGRRRKNTQNQLAKLLATRNGVGGASASKYWSGEQDQFWTPLNGSYGASNLFGEHAEPSNWNLVDSYEDCVFACVDLIASNIAQTELSLAVATNPTDPRPKSLTRQFDPHRLAGISKHYKKHTRKAVAVEEITDHGVLDLIDRPNNYQSFSQLLHGTQVYLDLIGSAFWHIGTFAEIPQELNLLPSHLVDIVTDDNGVVTGYTLNVGEEPQFLPKEKVIHFKNMNPVNPFSGFGTSALKSVWQPWQILRQEQATTEAVLTNAANPSAIVSPPDDGTGTGTFTDQQAQRLARQLGERFRMNQSGGVWVVTDAMDYKPISTPPKDLAELQIYDRIRSAVASSYHVPKALIELTDNTIGADDTTRRNFEEYCLRPRVNLICETLTQRLCPPRTFLAATDLITPDRTYELQRRQQNVTEVSANLRTQNEGRAELGLPPVQGGDKFLYQLTNLGVASGASPLGPKQNMARTPTTKTRTKGYTSTFPDTKALLDKLSEILGRIATDAIGAANLKAADGIATKAFIPLTDWTDRMAKELEPVLRAYYDEGSSAVFAEIGGDPDLRRLAVPSLDEAVSRAALALAESTLSTTELAIDEAVAQLRDQIRTGLGLGEANSKLADRVQEIFTSLTTQRCYLIADTEANRAKHAGELIAMNEAGVVAKKVWLPDSMACPLCKALDGKAVDMDQPFYTDPKGGPYAVVDHPPRHPGCRCSLQYEFENDGGR